MCKMAKKNSFYRHKKAVSTKNGIRSRTRRGQFAQHWWSKRWIDFIERLAEPGRMQRGRTYARQGQVLDIDVQPGLIEARVQGSRRTPYQVRLYFDIIDRSVLPLLIERFNRRASIAAYLLAGQMPPELEALFEEQGARLFPEPHVTEVTVSRNGQSDAQCIKALETANKTINTENARLQKLLIKYQDIVRTGLKAIMFDIENCKSL